MINKLLTTLALMLCMGALFLPVTAYAASDSTPPSVNAWLDDGDRLSDNILHVEASDRDSGVEAVSVNGHRFGYLVDGAIEVSPLEDYAGEDEYITVHAIDFAGNKSREVKIKNPYYTAPKPTTEQPQTTPAPDPTPQPSAPSSSSAGTTSQPSSTSRPSTTTPPVSSSTPEPTSTPESTESAVPDASEANPFTPDGTGSVQDNATEQDGKEFFTIITEDENIFYLIIDRQRDSEGVYLLGAVTEEDLMALAEKSGGTSGESVIPEPTPAPVEPDPTPESEPEPEQPTESKTGTIIFVLIAILAAGGAGYYFKILRPKQQAELEDTDDEDDTDEYSDEYGGEYDDGDEYDFSDEDAEFLDADPDGATDREGDGDEV